MPNPEAPDSRPLVLVVDDDMMIRLLIRESLEQAGFEVMEAEDGAKAIQRFTEKPPEIVLMDVEMPKLDGFSACAALRRLPHGQNTPIILVTGHDDAKTFNRGFDAGATDFLAKPINWTQLGFRIHYILRASQTQQTMLV